MSKVKIFKEKYKSLLDVDWDFADAPADSLSNIHPYPARFINEIPKTLIELIGCTKDSIVFDPFCGSGTTLVAAQRHRIESIGVDLNPIACLISKVKTKPLPDAFIDVLDETINNAEEMLNKEITIPEIPNLDHWFERDIQRALSSLLYVIQWEKNPAISDALKLSLSSIIVRVSNQESDTRYAAIHKNHNTTDVFKDFLISGKKLYQAKQEFPQTDKKAIILSRDIMNVTKDQIGRKVGLVITSPPYPNAYEYWLYHKYRMWWLGYDPIAVRTHEIGCRAHYQKKNGQTERDFYLQMNRVFELLNNCLIVGGHICFVVGRSIILGREIDNSALISEIGVNNGFSYVANISREIAATKKSFNLKYGKIKEENIVIFRKDR